MSSYSAVSALQEYLYQGKVLLAPMAGVTDEALRSLCLELGADLTYTEMVSSKALSFANEKTKSLLTLAPGEEQVAVQLFGHEPETMAAQAAWVEQHLGEKLAYLDVNMGCPARKICGKGDGSALMKDPRLAAEIVAAMVRAVEHPVTVKFRRGFYKGEETCVDFARRMEDAGAAACAVHGRYAEQMYHGQADWDAIARVVQAVSIPVLGNGDVASGKDARSLFDCTGCASILVGRAAEGNPWIFREIKETLAGQEPTPRPDAQERIAMARRHARLLSEREGCNIVRMRKHAMWYMFGLPGASTARARINECVTLDDFNQVFDELLEAVDRFRSTHPTEE